MIDVFSAETLSLDLLAPPAKGTDPMQCSVTPSHARGAPGWGWGTTGWSAESRWEPALGAQPPSSPVCACCLFTPGVRGHGHGWPPQRERASSQGPPGPSGGAAHGRALQEAVTSPCLAPSQWCAASWRPPRPRAVSGEARGRFGGTEELMPDRCVGRHPAPNK